MPLSCLIDSKSSLLVTQTENLNVILVPYFLLYPTSNFSENPYVSTFRMLFISSTVTTLDLS